MLDTEGWKKVTTAYFCVFLILSQAQFYRYWNQNRSCPVNLLYQLSNVVSRLYGYSRQPTTMRGEYAMAVDPGAAYTVNEDGYQIDSTRGAYGTAAANVGYQATSTGTPPMNQYNPACPWGLFNQMISRIKTYVIQMQATQGSGNPMESFGYVPYAMDRNPVPGGMFRGM